MTDKHTLSKKMHNFLKVERKNRKKGKIKSKQHSINIYLIQIFCMFSPFIFSSCKFHSRLYIVPE